MSTVIAPLVKGLSEEGMGHHSDDVPLYVCGVNASQLADHAGGDLLPNNPIDKYLAKNVPGVVRLFFGNGPGTAQCAPWLTALGSVVVHDPTDNVTATVARWWEADVQLAQKALVAKVAAKYDGLIPLIYIANGGTVYGEPFIRDVQDATTRRNLLAAGYTSDLDLASYEVGYRMFQAFKITRVAQAFNPWQYIRADGTYGNDAPTTLALMDKFAAIFPRRAVWANNSIRVGGGWPSAGYDLMYEHMKAAHFSAGRPIRFQTATKPRVGSYVETLDWALAHGAHAVELSPGYSDSTQAPFLTAAQLTHYNHLLQAA